LPYDFLIGGLNYNIDEVASGPEILLSAVSLFLVLTFLQIEVKEPLIGDYDI
jgi:hypothetical protein